MRILGISGSLRSGSYNTRLLRTAGLMMGEGGILEIFELSRVPLYDADLDRDTKPGPVQELLDAVPRCDGLLFATPEYNHSVPGVLKNALDWISRPAFKSVLVNKPAGMLSASTSPVGGARAQAHLRVILASTLTPVYLSPDFLLPAAKLAFDESGRLVDEAAEARLHRYVTGYLDWVRARLAADSRGATG